MVMFYDPNYKPNPIVAKIGQKILIFNKKRGGYSFSVQKTVINSFKKTLPVVHKGVF
jgi:hypothetical protein